MDRRTTSALGAVGVAFPYQEFGRDARFEEAAARWPLIRSTDRFLVVERDRRRAERERAAGGAAGNVAHLDTRRVPRPVGPPADWYLGDAPAPAVAASLTAARAGE